MGSQSGACTALTVNPLIICLQFRPFKAEIHTNYPLLHVIVINRYYLKSIRITFVVAIESSANVIQLRLSMFSFGGTI